METPHGKSERVALPPVVYVPCEEHVQDPTDAVVQFRNLDDGRIALMTYSALDRLQRCCGEQQPWLVVPTYQLKHLQEVQPFQEVLLDVVIPSELRTVPSDTRPEREHAENQSIRHTVS